MKNEAEHDGRWTASADGEVWPCEVSFASKEEAIAHARQEGWCRVGLAQALTADDVVTDRFLMDFAEFVDLWIVNQLEEFCREDGPLVELPQDGGRRVWIQQQLRLAIRAMLVRWYRIVDVEVLRNRAGFGESPVDAQATGT